MITKVLPAADKAKFLAGAYVDNIGLPFIRLGVWAGSQEVCIPLAREQADALADQLKAAHQGNTYVFVDAELVTVQGEG